MLVLDPRFRVWCGCRRVAFLFRSLAWSESKKRMATVFDTAASVAAALRSDDTTLVSIAIGDRRLGDAGVTALA